MVPIRLIPGFIRASFLEDAAYRANFTISVLNSLLNFTTGFLGIFVIFGQTETIQGWSYEATLAVLGVYLTVGSLRGLFIGPGLEALSGMDGEIWSGNFDFTLLRPVNIQFLVSLRKWRLFSLFDLLLGIGVIGFALLRMGGVLNPWQVITFLLALGCGLLVLYAFLLCFAALVFWSPGVLFTWIFDGIFQLARFPVGVYPGWLRLVLTWIIPVGLITTVPAEALNGTLSAPLLIGAVLTAWIMTICSSILFQLGLKRYSSASS